MTDNDRNNRLPDLSNAGLGAWAEGAKLDNVLAQAQKIGGRLKSDTDVIELLDLIAKAKNLIADEENDELKPQPIIIESDQ